MKRNVSLYIFIFIYIFFMFIMPFISIFAELYEVENSNPFDYARITDVDYKAEVVDEPNSKGKVIVTERLTFDIHAASKDNPFWELWRDLPEDYIDGLKVEYKVNSVKQILDDGSEVIYKESPKLYWDDSDYLSSSIMYGPGKWYHSDGPYNESARQYECVFFYVDGLYREKVTFEIEYEMTNAALKYNDCSELYLCLYSEDSIKYLKSFKGQILFPDKDMPYPGNYYAHTYGTNSNDFYFTESETLNPGYHTFSFELDKSQLKFRPYNQYIEFSLVSYGEDKHIFTEYAPNNYYSSDNVLSELKEEQEEYETTPLDYFNTKLFIFIISLIIALVIIFKTLRTDKKMRKKHIFYEPTMQMHYFREIPSNLDPSFASYLAFCKDKKKNESKDIYASIMLSLARKKYIELVKIDPTKDWIFNNVKIVIKYQPTPIQIPLVQTTLQSIEPPQDLFSDSTITVEPSISEQEIVEPELIPQEKLEPLTPTEEHYFNLLVRHSHGTEISMSNFQNKVSVDYENTDSFVRNVESSTVNIGISQGYFQKINYDQPKQKLNSKSTSYIIIGIILIIIVNLISYQTRLDLAFGAFFILGIVLISCAMYIKKIANKYILFTQFGEDEYVKWRGLYNFLNSETLMNERTIIELPIWEQYLVYATAFGISDKVIKAINIRCPESYTSPILSNPYYRSRNFYSSSRSFTTATRSASHTARSGGYGGGSWRLRWWWPWWWWWRRRPLIAKYDLKNSKEEMSSVLYR